jgi:hypothetical protein
MMKSILRVILPVALLTLAACAGTGVKSTGGSSRGSEAALMERALKRWDLLIGSDTMAAWEYLSPGYRQTHPKDIYARDMASRPVRWFKVEAFTPGPESTVDAVECDEAGQACDVRLQVHFKIRSHLTSVGVLESSSVVKESWVKLKDEWYLVPNDVGR